MSVSSSFTTRFPKHITGIVTPIKVRQTDLRLPVDDVSGYPCQAIWDTGAEVTVLGYDLIKQLQLEPDPTEQTLHLQTPSGVCETFPYRVDLILPGNIVKRAHRVLSCAPLSGGQVLIGMDIINHGDFSLQSQDNGTIFGFKLTR